jgi:hypothetical protein
VAETFVAVRDSVIRRAVVGRTAEAFVIDRCVADRRYVPRDSVLIIGKVEAPSGAPVSGLLVTLRKQSSAADGRRLPDSYRLGTDGLFQFCGRGVARDVPLVAEVWRGGLLAGSVILPMDGNLNVVRISASRP